VISARISSAYGQLAELHRANTDYLKNESGRIQRRSPSHAHCDRDCSLLQDLARKCARRIQCGKRCDQHRTAEGSGRTSQWWWCSGSYHSPISTGHQWQWMLPLSPPPPFPTFCLCQEFRQRHLEHRTSLQGAAIESIGRGPKAWLRGGVGPMVPQPARPRTEKRVSSMRDQSEKHDRRLRLNVRHEGWPHSPSRFASLPHYALHTRRVASCGVRASTSDLILPSKF
jgi:hypothetical protein